MIDLEKIEKYLKSYCLREKRIFSTSELNTFLHHMYAGEVPQDVLEAIPDLWRRYLHMQGYYGDGTTALAKHIKNFNNHWYEVQPLDEGSCYLYFNSESRKFELKKYSPKCDSIYCSDRTEAEKLLKILEQHQKDNIQYWVVCIDNPFYDRCDKIYYLNEFEAQDQYDEYVSGQGGRSSFDDDEGGMDYSIDECEDTLVNVFAYFEAVDWFDFF